MAVIEADLRDWLDQELRTRVETMARDAEVSLPTDPQLAAAGPGDIADPQDRLDEVTQYLRNLGYIDSDRAINLAEAAADKTDLAAGYLTFAREARDWLARDVGRRPGKDLRRAVDDAARQDLTDHPLQFDALLVEALRQLTSLDGEFKIGRMVTKSDNGVLVRVAQFRLVAYGFFDDAVDGIWDNSLSTRIGACLNLMQSFVRGASPKPILDRLGNVTALMEDCANHGKLRDTPIVIKRKGQGFGSIDQAISTPFVTAASRNVYELRGSDLPVWHDANGIKRTLRETEQEFAVHLLQNVLWVNGYYEGRVDGFFFDMSASALANAYDQHRAAHPDAVKAIRHLFVAVRLPDLRDILSEQPTALTERENDLKGVVEDKAESSTFLGRLFAGVKDIFKTAVEKGRSVMVGVGKLLKPAKDLLAGVGEKLKQAVDAVAGFIVDRVRDLIGKVRNLAVLVFRGLREAFLFLNRALDPIRHFLFGEPIISMRENGEAFAVSRFQVDRDGVQCVLPTATAAEIADHFDLCGRLSRIFTASIRLAVIVARIAIAGVSGPPGWIMAAISFTRLIADVVPLIAEADEA